MVSPFYAQGFAPFLFWQNLGCVIWQFLTGTVVATIGLSDLTWLLLVLASCATYGYLCKTECPLG